MMAYSAIEKDVLNYLQSSIHTIHICSTGNGHAAYCTVPLRLQF